MFGVRTENKIACRGGHLWGEDSWRRLPAHQFALPLSKVPCSAIIISGVVPLIGNFVALASIKLLRAYTGGSALGVFIQKNADNPIWGESRPHFLLRRGAYKWVRRSNRILETVLFSLGVAVRLICVAAGGSLQRFTPFAVRLGASLCGTSINHNEGSKAGTELLEDILSPSPVRPW